MGSDFLLEIGTEEIPARFIPPVMEEMVESFQTADEPSVNSGG